MVPEKLKSRGRGELRTLEYGGWYHPSHKIMVTEKLKKGKGGLVVQPRHQSMVPPKS